MMGESPDGLHFLYYQDGVFFSYDMVTGKSADLTSKIPSKFYDVDNDVNVVKPPTPSLGWSKDSSAVLLSDGWDVWQVPVAGGQPVNLTVNGGKTHRGILRGLRRETVVLETERGELLLPMAAIKSANLEYDVRLDLQRDKQQRKQHNGNDRTHGN